MPSDHHNNNHHPHTSRFTRRSRSRSPRDRHHRNHDVKPRHRSRSPRDRESKRHHHHHHHTSSSSSSKTHQPALPFSQPPLRRHHLPRYRALFASYLDLQKNLDISTLSETELKGRWKSFVGKWNRGELAEGWYEPGTKERADERARESEPVEGEAAPERRVEAAPGEEDEEEDEFGPALPAGQRTGPSAPTVQDLRERAEAAGEERAAARADLRFERKAERRAQKERLEELVPRAEPGSRERQLEKKRDAAAANRAFAEGREAGGAAEVPEADVMGGGDGVEEYKKQVGERQRAKNEREVRKEEQLRAREVEREERLAEHRRKEDKTMEMLRALAQQRYG